jgi:hypothetical protein
MPRFALLLTLAAALLPAQYTTGRLDGTVTDPTASPVPAAAVKLTSLATNATREAESNEQGYFLFPALAPGLYRVEVTKSGFSTTIAEAQVLISQTSTVNFALKVGDQPITLTVTAEAAPALITSEPTRSTTRDRLEIESLPNIGRNIINMISLAPGVQPTFNPRGGQLVTISGAQAGQISANGGRSKASAHYLDSVDANDWEFGGIALGTQPTPDMMQEFKVLANNWSAEYGVKASAQVLMITKQGSNALHGSAYNFLQNAALNSRDYFDRTGRSTPLRQNFFGFTAGGPVVKDRLFVFGGYEGRETRGAGSTVIANLPTEAARSRVTDPSVRQILTLLPVPTSPTANPNVGTLASQLTSPSSSDQFIARGDYMIHQNQTLTMRYYQNVGTALNRLAGGVLPGFDATFDPVGRNAVVAHTTIISPTATNEIRAAYGRSSALFSPETDPATPRYTVTGLLSFGTVNNWPQGRIFNVYNLNDNFTYIAGRHVIKAGFDFRHIRDNSVNDTNRRGVYTFPNLDSFLAGTLSNWTQVFGNTYRGFRTNFHGLFLQDDIRVTQSLTLNLGLRYEFQGGLREVNQLQSVLDPRLSGPIGQAGVGVLGGFRNESPTIQGNPLQFAPRIGFAWNPKLGKLVVRGGYGIFYDSLIFNGLQAGRTTPPSNYTGALAGTQFTGANSLANLLAGNATIQQQLSAQIGGFGTLTNLGRVVSSMPVIQNPYMQHFSFGLQYQVAGGLVADLSYVGTKGTSLTTYGPGNSVQPGLRPAPAVSLADEQARLTQFQQAVGRQNGPGNTRLDPRFNDVDLLRDNGSSVYHSMQFEVRKSFANGYMFRGSYTWAKSIDNSSDYSPGQNPTDSNFAQDQFSLRNERGVSNFDIPHRFALTNVWQLPFFKDRTKLTGKILGGWNFASINQIQSGVPATILAGARFGILDINQDGNGVSGGDNTRANCVAGAPRYELGRPVGGNPQYVQPLLGNMGNCGRNTFRMNRLFNYDWSFAKNFQLSERGPIGSGPYALEFRADLFNIFNVPFLTATGNEWRTVVSPQFGQYNAAGAARRIQMSLRLTF